MTDPRETSLNQHKARHLVYWQNHGNPKLEIHRYEAGFNLGWSDAGEGCHGKERYDNRRREHINQCGENDHVWEFEHGYEAGQKARSSYDKTGNAVYTPDR